MRIHPIILLATLFLENNVSAQKRHDLFNFSDSIEMESESRVLLNYDFYKEIIKDSIFTKTDSIFLKFEKDIFKHHTMAELFVYINNYDDENILKSCSNAIKLINHFLLYNNYLIHFYRENLTELTSKIVCTKKDLYVKIPYGLEEHKVQLILKSIE